MTFQNPTIPVDELPQSLDIEFTKLDGKYAPLCLAVTAFVEFVFITAGMIVLIVFPATRDFLTTTDGLLLSVLGFIALLWIALKTWLTAVVIRYSLRQHDLVVTTGIFWRSETIQPLRRVQHVELTHGPLEKRYGLANVKLFSAGTGQSTFIVPGLKLSVAERIKTYILDYQALAKAQDPV